MKNDEQKRELIKLIISGTLFLIAFAVDNIIDHPLSILERILLYVVPYLIAGWDIIKEAFGSIIHGELFDENFLMTIASLGAFAVGECPEAVIIVLLYGIGEYYEDKAVDKSKTSLEDLLVLTVNKATVIRNGTPVDVKTDEIATGEKIIVKPGEKIPLDGTVVDGFSELDTSALTGESLPLSVNVGIPVLSGAINLTGVLTIEVTKRYEDSTAAVIEKTVTEAIENKPRVDRFITKFAKTYTPVVVILAVLVSFVVPLVTGEPISEWVQKGLMLLVISCPCALVVSVPLCFFVGIGRAAKNGVLIKGCKDIEALDKVKIVALDKTGTVTKGKLSVVSCHAVYDEDELTSIVSAAELYSNHPVAKAIVSKFATTLVAEGIEEISGKGISCSIQGTPVFVGKADFIKEQGVTPIEPDAIGTTVHALFGTRYLGFIVVADEIKPYAAESVSELKSLGIKEVVMLTGDNETVARDVANKVSIDTFNANLLPTDKLSSVKNLKRKGSVLFAGDGINDAPSLAEADVGVAMGECGADVAIKTADVVLMNSKLEALPFILRLSHNVMKILKQNIALSLTIKALIFALSLTGWANMWFAVFADVGTLILSLANIRRIK